MMKDHKQIGVEQELYYFDELSPGCCFFLPHGTRVHKRLREYLEKEYWHRGFQEVITPQMAKNQLWVISGHWAQYKDDMFGMTNNKGKLIDGHNPEDQEDDVDMHGYSICPMNCITGDAMVSLSNNTSMRLDQLVNPCHTVLGYDENQTGIVNAKQLAFLNQGQKKCVELIFLDGRRLICTEDHRLLTSTGWVKAIDLIEEQSSIVASLIPPIIEGTLRNDWTLEFKSNKYQFKFSMDNIESLNRSLAFARLCGAIITDGSITKTKYSYTGEVYVGHEIDLQSIRDDLKLVTNHDKYRYRADRNLWCLNLYTEFATLIADLFGYGNRMYTSNLLPEFIMDHSLPIDFVRQFLSGMFGGDGWAPVLSKNQFTEVYMALSKTKEKLDILKKFFEQIVTLLERAGVKDCSISGPYKNQKGSKYHYRIKIPMTSITNFTKYIGFAHNCHKAQRLAIVNSYYSLKTLILDQNQRFKDRCKELTDFPNKAMTITKACTIVAKEFEDNEYIYLRKFSIPSPTDISNYLCRGGTSSLYNIGGRGFYTPTEYLTELGAMKFFDRKYSIPRGTTIPTFKLKLLKRSDAGLRNVYDITVDEDKQSFLANGIVVHNCPKHCLIFRSRVRSYRELPMRLADFGMLHRNEDTGALRGLLRTRCFQQDDAHIFCRRNQIRDEIRNCLGFLEAVYGRVKLDFSLELSTRPDKFIGSEDVWNDAESQLEAMLNEYSEKTGRKWTLNAKDGAFYGPKIDVHVKDSLGRSHQCATIQLDFNLPSSDRFNLRYINEVGDMEEPVIIHRAIFGSFGRFMGILTEHFQGRWPFWLSPRQVKVIPISEKFVSYAQQVADVIHKDGFYVDVDSSDNTVQYKIAVAQTDMYNYMVVVGQREMDKGTVNIRYRDVSDKKEVKLDELIVELKSLQ